MMPTHPLISVLFGLLPLAVAAYFGYALCRQPPQRFASAGPVAALLLVGQVPLLLLLRLAFTRPMAAELSLLLFGACLFVLNRVLAVPGRRAAPPAWRFWLLGLASLAAAGTASILTGHFPAGLTVPVWVGSLGSTLGLGAMAALLHWAHPGAAAQRERRKFPALLPEEPTLHQGWETVQRAYYCQADGVTPNPGEFRRWCLTLTPAVQGVARRVRPEQAWAIPAFRRFVLEARGHSYVAYMAERLDPAQFAAWVDAHWQEMPVESKQALLFRPR